MAKFLMELCLPEYTSLQFLPSQQAAAALHLALKLHNSGDWVSGNDYCTTKNAWAAVGTILTPWQLFNLKPSSLWLPI